MIFLTNVIHIYALIPLLWLRRLKPKAPTLLQLVNEANVVSGKADLVCVSFSNFSVCIYVNLVMLKLSITLRNPLINKADISENSRFTICYNRRGWVTYGKYCVWGGGGGTKGCTREILVYSSMGMVHRHKFGHSTDLRVSPIYGAVSPFGSQQSATSETLRSFCTP
jgi:hypothetical protein